MLSCVSTHTHIHTHPYIIKHEQPDLDPQDGAICPLGQVHMLGLEQKPSPHELRQIAACRNRTLSNNMKNCRVQDKIAAQRSHYGAGILSLTLRERKLMLCICCLSACPLQVLSFWLEFQLVQLKPRSKTSY